MVAAEGVPPLVALLGGGTLPVQQQALAALTVLAGNEEAIGALPGGRGEGGVEVGAVNEVDEVVEHGQEGEGEGDYSSEADDEVQALRTLWLQQSVLQAVAEAPLASASDVL